MSKAECSDRVRLALVFQRVLFLLSFGFLWHLILLEIRIQFYLFQAQWWVGSHMSHPHNSHVRVDIISSFHTWEGRNMLWATASDKLTLRPKWVSWLCNLCKVDQQSVTSVRTSHPFPLWTSLIALAQCCWHYLPVYLLPSLVYELHRSSDLGLIPHAPCRVPGIEWVEDFVVRWLFATFEKWRIWKCVMFGLWTSPPVLNSRDVFT